MKVRLSNSTPDNINIYRNLLNDVTDYYPTHPEFRFEVLRNAILEFFASRFRSDTVQISTSQIQAIVLEIGKISPLELDVMSSRTVDNQTKKMQITIVVSRIKLNLEFYNVLISSSNLDDYIFNIVKNMIKEGE